MEGNFRRVLADACSADILRLMQRGMDYGGLLALLSEYSELKRENAELKCENAELKKMAFRLNDDLPCEIWRDVLGYEGLYQVSNFVRFKSFHRGMCVIRVPKVTGNRYADICLSKNGVSKSFLVHRVVALAFVPNFDPVRNTEVHHINGNKHDNRPENLMWVSPEEHIQLSLQNENNSFGKPHFDRRKLLDEQVRYIRENPDVLSQIKLGKMFGVSNSTIWMIQHGKIYMDVK